MQFLHVSRQKIPGKSAKSGQNEQQRESQQHFLSIKNGLKRKNSPNKRTPTSFEEYYQRHLQKEANNKRHKA
jgi:hypothetical protein